MCFTQFQSTVLSLAIFAVAAYEHKTFRNWQYTMGVGYFGLMEALQAIQHSFLAVPDDDYQMCQSRTNQILTWLGALHIAFQPLFVNMCIVAPFRRTNLQDRIESDLVQRLCLLGGLWLMWSSAYVAIWDDENPAIAAPATEACPNYEWIKEGYDPHLKASTPNEEGFPCTYKSQSEVGHLAWVIPMYQSTYFMPSSSMHMFLMFFPYWVVTRRIIVPMVALVLFLTGPFFVTNFVTPSLNEQASIWCFFSVIQVMIGVVAYRRLNVWSNCCNRYVVHRGGIGEEPMVYQLLRGPTYANNEHGTPTKAIKKTTSQDDDEMRLILESTSSGSSSSSSESLISERQFSTRL